MIERLTILACVIAAGCLVGILARMWTARSTTPTSSTLPAGLWLFTSPYCAPCKHLRGLLGAHPAVTFQEVSVVERPDLVRALDVRSAPTLVAIDANGRVTGSLGSTDAGRLSKFLADVAALHGESPS